MRTILLSPYSAKLQGGKQNAKEYHRWPEVVAELKTIGYEIIQLGLQGEQRIDGVDQFVIGESFKKIRDLVNISDCWLSVDSFLPHFCHCEKLKRGVVVFGPSDSRIFGHPENINLLRSRDYLRPHQYQTWMEWDFDPQAFVTPEKVVAAMCQLAPMLSKEIPLLMAEPLRSL